MTKECEIWKDTIISSKYEVSNLGKIRSKEVSNIDARGRSRLKRGWELKPLDNGKGYYRVCINGKMYYIHRLVAQAFIPNPNNLSEVNHINENPADNRADNLEWCTRLYNNNYGNRLTLLSESAKKASVNKLKPVIMTTDTGEIEFASLSEASKITGLP